LHYYTGLENYSKFMHVLSALGMAAFHPIYYKYHASLTVPHLTQCVRWETSAYLRTNYNYWHLDPSSRSSTTDMGRKFGRGYAPLGVGGGPHLTQCRKGQGLGYLCTKWHLNPSSHLATTDVGRKSGLCPFGGAGSSWFVFVLLYKF